MAYNIFVSLVEGDPEAPGKQVSLVHTVATFETRGQAEIFLDRLQEIAGILMKEKKRIEEETGGPYLFMSRSEQEALRQQ